MFGLFLIVSAGAWFAFDYWRRRVAEERDAAQRAEKVANCRLMVARATDAPWAHEKLGDALREEEDLEAAIAEYEQALTLQGPSDNLLGDDASTGLETKLRLTRLEQDQALHPERYGLTLKTRDVVCTRCASVNVAALKDCANCGAPLPTDTFLGALQHTEIRADIVAAAKQAATMVAVILLGLLFCSFLSVEIRCCLAIAVIIVVPLRLLARFGSN